MGSGIRVNGALELADSTHTASDRATLHLWYAYPGDLNDEYAAERCLALLSEPERERLKKFRFEAGRREYLVAHALVRVALSHSGSLAPQAWRFQVNTYGKPAIDPDCGLPPQQKTVAANPGLSFNLSHSQALCACVVAQGDEVGIDVEHRDSAARILEVAPRAFSSAELVQLDLLPKPEQLDRALSLWTLKEAYIKALGMGFSLPVNNISFLFGGTEGICLELDPSLGLLPAGWRMCLLDHIEHRVAIVGRLAADPRMQQWTMQPLSRAPLRLEADREQWFPGITQ